MTRAVWIMLLLPLWLQGPLANAGAPARDGILEQHVNQQLDSIRTSLSDGADFERAAAQLTTLLDQVLAYEHASLPSRYVELARLRRLAVAFSGLSSPQMRAALWTIFESNPTFADALAFAIRPEDDPGGIARVTLQLERSRVAFDSFPSLAATIAVVHDQPPVYRPDRRMTVRAESPATIFTYFATHQRGATMSVKDLPVELLVHVVDATAQEEELQWAHQRHRNDQRVGKRYNDVPYDTGFFKYNRAKVITGEDYTLQNIQTKGGVCVDQAYYAAHVGKAIAVPTVTLVGRGAETGHMWVGYLEKVGRRIRWNFEEGRWDDYEHLRGETTHPQTRAEISDGDLIFNACCTQDRFTDRRWAAAHTDAAQRVIQLAEDPASWPPAWPLTSDAPEPFSVTVNDALDMLEEAVREAPHHAPAWETVRVLAEDGKLDAKARTHWSGALMRMVGRSNPDFMMGLLAPMVRSVEDPEQQIDLWKRVGKLCSGRPDLEAEVLLAQGRVYAGAGKRADAWRTFETVAKRYGDESPLVVDALREAERLLGRSRSREAIPLYEAAFARIPRPQQMSEEFKRSSNQYRVGSRYAALLASAGRTADAERIRRQIGYIPEP